MQVRSMYNRDSAHILFPSAKLIYNGYSVNPDVFPSLLEKIIVLGCQGHTIDKEAGDLNNRQRLEQIIKKQQDLVRDFQYCMNSSEDQCWKDFYGKLARSQAELAHQCLDRINNQD